MGKESRKSGFRIGKTDRHELELRLESHKKKRNKKGKIIFQFRAIMSCVETYRDEQMKCQYVANTCAKISLCIIRLFFYFLSFLLYKQMRINRRKKTHCKITDCFNATISRTRGTIFSNVKRFFLFVFFSF